MLVKFLARGTGSARDAAGKPRAGVEVLRGDPHQVAAVADTLPFDHKYTSGVIAWAPEDAPTDDQISEVLDAFEETAWAGLETRPLRPWGRASPRARRQRSRPCPRRTVRPGDRPEPQHRPSGLAEDVRPAPRRLSWDLRGTLPPIRKKHVAAITGRRTGDPARGSELSLGSSPPPPNG